VWSDRHLENDIWTNDPPQDEISCHLKGRQQTVRVRNYNLASKPGDEQPPSWGLQVSFTEPGTRREHGIAWQGDINTPAPLSYLRGEICPEHFPNAPQTMEYHGGFYK